jgi:hypothetical protein
MIGGRVVDEEHLKRVVRQCRKHFDKSRIEFLDVALFVEAWEHDPNVSAAPQTYGIRSGSVARKRVWSHADRVGRLAGRFQRVGVLEKMGVAAVFESLHGKNANYIEEVFGHR